MKPIRLTRNSPQEEWRVDNEGGNRTKETQRIAKSKSMRFKVCPENSRRKHKQQAKTQEACSGFCQDDQDMNIKETSDVDDESSYVEINE